MKRPRTALAGRPVNLRSTTARTRKEAAIHLVRLEFDIAKIEMGLAQAAQRTAQGTADLVQKSQQRARLLDIMQRGDDRD